MGAESILRLQYHDFPAGGRQAARNRQSDHARADDGALDPLCHNRLNCNSARQFTLAQR
jgi:hypothetical protein